MGKLGDIDLNGLFKERKNEFQAGNFLGIEEHYQISWDWDIPQDTYDMWLKQDGFIYKCIADSRSTRQQHMEFGFYAGRNIIECIFKCLPFGHLGSDIIEIWYPEAGLSPADQARFVWMCSEHPDWHMVKELRIVTRSPFLVSDCKSPFCRVISEDQTTSSVEGAELVKLEARDKFSDQRIHAIRPDLTFSSRKKLGLLYLWGAKTRKCVAYLGEDDTYVYWTEPNSLLEKKPTVNRSTHYNMWYEVNALWCNTLTVEDLFEHAASGKPMDDFMDNIINDVTIPAGRLAQMKEDEEKK